MMKWALILCTVLLSSCGDILCARGMSEGEEVEVADTKGAVQAVESIVTRKLVIVGWFCYALAFFSLMGLLSVAAMTVAIPATAFSFVLDTIAARFVLHEHIPWRRWVGVVCVTVGVALAVKPTPNRNPLAGPAGPNGAAVQPCKDEAGHDKRGAQQLDEQRTPCKVLAKP